MSKLENSTEFQYSKVPTKYGENNFGKTVIPLKYGYGVRHVQLVIFFLSLSMSFIARGHLGVTLVAMTSHEHFIKVEEVITERNNVEFNNTQEALAEESGTYFNNIYGLNATNIKNVNATVESNDNEEPWTVYRTYYWGKPIQEMVLTSFFLGYFLMMFPIALVCQRWGGKVPLQVSMFVNGAVSILTPWMALWGGWKAVCVCRVLQGLAQAGTYPGIQTLLAQWVPSDERATLSSYVYTAQVGVAASLICASYASSTTVAIICFVVTMSCHMGIHTGWMVNHIDLAPNYSGTLMALGNTLTNVVVLVMPALVSNIVIDLKNVYQWRIMMYLVAGIAFIPNVIFVIFMSADVQPWNEGIVPEAEKQDVKLESIKKKEAEK